ncbi:hypothetical protein GCM10009092_09860 [Bowmanella denitrificans]|uniref:Thioesterase n=1 Tax=Bowmanella denitrificans TaxID=366582 RepID=A0ABN0WWB8_9ALTE
MNLYLRLMLAVLRGLLGRKLHLLDEGVTYHRVWPWDLDAYGHMNNGRYLQISDVARIELMCRTNAAHIIFKRRFGGVLGGSLVRHVRALKVFSRYLVVSRVLCWDERWFYTEHRFETLSGKVITTCITRAALRCKKDWAGTSDIVNSVAPGLCSPIANKTVCAWMKADQALSEATQPINPADSANDSHHDTATAVNSRH